MTPTDLLSAIQAALDDTERLAASEHEFDCAVTDPWVGHRPRGDTVNLLCLFGLHSRIHVPEPGPWRSDLYRCRRCPGQWRIGSHGYWWGSVHYKERIADREETW